MPYRKRKFILQYNVNKQNFPFLFLSRLAKKEKNILDCTCILKEKLRKKI